MKIECTLKRKGGTHVDLEGKDYHFKPEAVNGVIETAHVCEVATKSHIKTFLAIDAYQVFDGADVEFNEPARQETAETIISNVDAPTEDENAANLGLVGETSVEGADTVIIETSQTVAAGDESVQIQTISAEEIIADGTVHASDVVADVVSDTKAFEDMNLDEARAAFKAVFEREAHPMAKAPSIIRKLVENRDVDAPTPPTDENIA